MDACATPLHVNQGLGTEDTVASGGCRWSDPAPRARVQAHGLGKDTQLVSTEESPLPLAQTPLCLAVVCRGSEASWDPGGSPLESRPVAQLLVMDSDTWPARVQALPSFLTA